MSVCAALGHVPIFDMRRMRVVPLPAGCPVQPPGKGDAINPLNNIPTALSHSPSTSGSAGASSSSSGSSLSAQRQRSSIPMAPPDKLPPHQQQGQDAWVYPSEQMFFNAMRRKVGLALLAAAHRGFAAAPSARRYFLPPPPPPTHTDACPCVRRTTHRKLFYSLRGAGRLQGGLMTHE